LGLASAAANAVGKILQLIAAILRALSDLKEFHPFWANLGLTSWSEDRLLARHLSNFAFALLLVSLASVALQESFKFKPVVKESFTPRNR
jgi:hypothetical protein